MANNSNLDSRLEALFPTDEGLPCPDGMALLRAFAEARPADFSFLEPDDLVDLRNSAFAGIPEWEAFSQHFASCQHCDA